MSFGSWPLGIDVCKFFSISTPWEMEFLLLVAKKSIDRHFYTIRFKLSLFGTLNLATLFLASQFLLNAKYWNMKVYKLCYIESKIIIVSQSHDVMITSSQIMKVWFNTTNKLVVSQTCLWISAASSSSDLPKLRI